MTETEELIFPDMTACEPKSALKREFAEGVWLLVDYETGYGMRGTMVFADPQLNAAQLELALKAKGQFKIYLGINYTKSPYGMVYSGYSSYGNLEVKLTDDQAFTRVAAESASVPDPVGPPGSRVSKLGKGKNTAVSIQEVFWKVADLTDQALSFRPPIPPYNDPHCWGISNLSYVRLEPLSADEQADWRKLLPTDETRRVTNLYCSGNLSGHIDNGVEFHPTDKDWYKNEIQPMINTDIDIFSIEAIRGNYCIFNTKVGDPGGETGKWQDEWMDSLACFTELAHENGIKMFAAVRMIGPGLPYVRDEPLGRARFFHEHPEWTKRDIEGIPTTNHSIAFPEVREYWLSLMREALDYGLDGLVLYCNRFKPFVLFEEPTVTAFINKFGEDPRKLDEEDPRWVRHCAGYLTVFLREIRELINEKPGRELAVVHYGGPSQYDKGPGWHPILYNCDVERWIEDGLVDYLFPTQYPLVELIEKWSKMAKGRVKIRPDLMPTSQAGEDLARLAKKYYDAGADGITLRDGERRAGFLTEWAVQSRLGHVDMLDHLIETAPSYCRRIPLKTLNGYSARYSYNNFGSIDPLLRGTTKER